MLAIPTRKKVKARKGRNMFDAKGTSHREVETRRAKSHRENQ